MDDQNLLVKLKSRDSIITYRRLKIEEQKEEK